MAWWKILLIALGGIVGGGVLDLAVLWAIVAITERRMERKYPDWKHRGGRRS